MTKIVDEGLISTIGKALIKRAAPVVKRGVAGMALGGAAAELERRTAGPRPTNTPSTSRGADDFGGLNYDKFAKHARSFESGGRKYGNANYGSSTNFGFEGAYGTGSQALETAGLLKPGASKRYGIKGANAAIYQPDAWAKGYSREQYLKSPEQQDKVYRQITKANYDSLVRSGVIKPGMSDDEVAGRLYAAAHGGTGGAKKFFLRGKDTSDFKFSGATVGKSYAAMRQHWQQHPESTPGTTSTSYQPGVVTRAINAVKNAFNEEAEQIDELSKGAMGRYINKAKDQIDTTSYKQGIRDATSQNMLSPASQKAERRLSKRHRGIEMAVTKLTKEDVINRALDKYVPEIEVAEPLTLDEEFALRIEHLQEAHALTLLKLFDSLNESNKITMINVVESDQGIRELLDFAIDKYSVKNN